ncbi:MAG: hypothetical protein MUE37_10915 [Bacteroidales bacterium]|nr:hypothetical protein [Bacteroidales bacterium]
MVRLRDAREQVKEGAGTGHGPGRDTGQGNGIGAATGQGRDTGHSRNHAGGQSHGYVVSVEGESPNTTALIDFKTAGTKKLLLRFAKLTKL